MKYFILFLLAFATILCADQGWLEDYEEAVKLATKENKPILADFTGSDWCGWCIKLKKEVFQTAEFKKWAKEKVVLLEVDFPKKKKLSQKIQEQNKALQAQYKIRGFPTIIFIKVNENQEVSELGRTGYVKGGPKAWISEAEGLLQGNEVTWLHHYETAVKQAKEAVSEDQGESRPVKKQQKPRLIVADFTGSDWCGWCIKLKEEVFDTAEFKKWAKENVVLLEVDFPAKKKLPKNIQQQNDSLQARYKVKGFPTVLFLTVEGEKVGELGYMEGGPEAWTAKAQEIVTEYNK